MNAYRIVDWWQYEVTSKGRVAERELSVDQLRKGPHLFVAVQNRGRNLSPGLRLLNKRAWQKGDAIAPAAFGLFVKLLEFAGSQGREHRGGWILDGRQQPMTAETISETTGWDQKIIACGLEVLVKAGWIAHCEFVDKSAELSTKSVKLGKSPEFPEFPENSGRLIKESEDKGREGKLREKALLSLALIFPRQKQADQTTLRDICSQLSKKTGAELLLDKAVVTARRCSRAHNPIARFVAAMKLPPFEYRPVGKHRKGIRP